MSVSFSLGSRQPAFSRAPIKNVPSVRIEVRLIWSRVYALDDLEIVRSVVKVREESRRNRISSIRFLSINERIAARTKQDVI